MAECCSAVAAQGHERMRPSPSPAKTGKSILSNAHVNSLARRRERACGSAPASGATRGPCRWGRCRSGSRAQRLRPRLPVRVRDEELRGSPRTRVSRGPPRAHARRPSVPVIRNCTPHGWSTPSLPYYEACHFEDGPEDTGDKRQYLATVKTIYSVGYGLSLASLIAATLVFCVFRTLLCTRTYVHLNLFSSFILRGTAVFVKDAVLFADEGLDHCSVSTVACKAAVALFHCCVLANFSWLLVEGLYLHTVLLFTFAPHRRLFWTYTVLGWGSPSLTTVIWIVFKSLYDNRGCWDDLDSSFWWIIKAPILASVLVNFVLFVNIIRIIFQKMKTSGMEGAEGAQYLRLAKSTLLLVPLFGVHYVVFALFPEHVGFQLRLCFELILGSFQGFVVALLYCFLNSEVQQEAKKQMRRSLRSSAHDIIAASVPSLDRTA